MDPSTDSGNMAVQVRRGELEYTISLRCTLCNYQFRSPKILPCFHSFCEACLYTVVSRSSSKTPTGSRHFPCPICRKKTEILKAGVQTLQTNYVLAAQVIRLNLSQSKPECSVCAVKRKSTQEPTYAVLKCWECDKFLCSKCVRTHTSLLKFHTLIQLSKSGPFKVIRHSYCAKHPEEHLRFYCLKCEDTICRDCRMTKHAEGHQSVDMVDLQHSAKEMVARVNEVITGNFIPVLDANREFFKREFEEKRPMKLTLKAAIKEREKVLLKVVQCATQAALQHLEDFFQKMEDDARKYKDNLARMCSEVEFNELVIESGCEADVMQAAINVMAYTNNKSPQACLVSIPSHKQELVWEKEDVAPFIKEGSSATTATMTLQNVKDFADAYMGRVNVTSTKMTLSHTQVAERTSLTKGFRKIGLLVDAYQKNYKNIAK
ncbi:E3 ubiquitin-protein ligase TRIM56-like [Littorina saxatilis]|uniref:Uncharacterized protein n=1 Tax=Littorina saxatilis TaxID=31220 RepID=A0AAN9BM24_9CAEN